MTSKTSGVETVTEETEENRLASRSRAFITVGLMLGMLMAAMESTVVSTAMPTVIHDLHGIRLYPWVLSAYLLTSTTTVPIYGKLADLLGRRRVFLFATCLFLVGSMLSGIAHSMPQLIAFRALQGVGAGGVLPLTLTIIGDLYPLKERARIQSLFTAVWSTASLGGPLLGAILTEQLSWRWVFYINLPFGILSALLVGRLLREHRASQEPARIDYGGSLLLTGGVFALLILMQQAGTGVSWLSWPMVLLAAVTLLTLFAFLRQERRSTEPMLPLELFANPVLLTALVGNILIGVMLYAMDSYMPLYMQAVRGGKPSSAGLALTPLILAWSLSAFIGARTLIRHGFRRLATFGATCILLASLSLMFTSMTTGTPQLIATMALMGTGLGPCSMAFLVSAQNAVKWRQRGVVTASSLFFRTLGGAVGVGALGAILNARMATMLAAANLSRFDPNDLLNESFRKSISPHALDAATHALANGLHLVFTLLAVISLMGLVSIVLISNRPMRETDPETLTEAADKADLEEKPSSFISETI